MILSKVLKKDRVSVNEHCPRISRSILTSPSGLKFNENHLRHASEAFLMYLT